MSLLEQVVSLVRFAFLDTTFGIAGLVTLYVFVKLVHEYRNK